MPRSRDQRRRRRDHGFTIVELVIVVTIMAIIAAVAVPNLIRSRMAAHESAAISVLRSVSTAQAQFSRSVYADEDSDGAGEYGTFGELCGRAGIRNVGGRKAPTDLSSGMGEVGAHGEVARNGYVYRMYLPLAGGTARKENGGGGIDSSVLSATLAELHWCCYAWPERQGASGDRAFFVNERGEITTTEDPQYSGPGCSALRAGAAFLTRNADSMTANIAIGTRGADGNYWKTVQ